MLYQCLHFIGGYTKTTTMGSYQYKVLTESQKKATTGGKLKQAGERGRRHSRTGTKNPFATKTHRSKEWTAGLTDGLFSPSRPAAVIKKNSVQLLSFETQFDGWGLKENQKRSGWLAMTSATARIAAASGHVDPCVILSNLAENLSRAACCGQRGFWRQANPRVSPPSRKSKHDPTATERG